MRADEGKIARRYARAALLFCEAEGGHEAFGEGLEKMAEAMRQVPLLQTMLTTPIVKQGEKLALVNAVARQLALPAAVVRFVTILVERNRADYLPAIGRTFRQLLDEKHNCVRADVFAPVALGEDDRKRIASGLSSHFARQVICSFYVDETLYGGVRARVGNTVIDSSIRGKLDKIRQRIAAVTS